MSGRLAPGKPREVIEAVCSAPRVIPVGAETKPRLSAVDAVKISTQSLRGIVEYDPSEFTFTALAGTPIREIAATLAERGQYLPFDPMLVEAGATLGGTIASGLSGPGRFRFGGIRDFILGVQFVDGAGRLLRLGGKVVKNAAGFDIPKFFTGSLGRFGLLVEATFKVFPQPPARMTLKLEASSAETAAQIMTTAASSRWELDALDWLPDEPTLAVRLAGPSEALPSIAKEILARWSGQTIAQDEADVLWKRLREFKWAQGNASLVKTPISFGVIPALMRAIANLPAIKIHISAGGNAAFISLPQDQLAALARVLREQGLSGILLRGNGALWLGRIERPKIAQAVKQALDAENRFPSLDE